MSTDVSEVRSASNIRAIIALMEAARTSETSVDIHFRTRQYIPEDSELYTRRRENLKSHNRLQCLPITREWYIFQSRHVTKIGLFALASLSACGLFNLAGQSVCLKAVIDVKDLSINGLKCLPTID
jgi:hypothetical protein